VVPGLFLHTTLTGAAIRLPVSLRSFLSVDIVFILAILALYAATHWLVTAVARLGGFE
jgi:hypothetical protein